MRVEFDHLLCFLYADTALLLYDKVPTRVLVIILPFRPHVIFLLFLLRVGLNSGVRSASSFFTFA